MKTILYRQQLLFNNNFAIKITAAGEAPVSVAAVLCLVTQCGEERCVTILKTAARETREAPGHMKNSKVLTKMKESQKVTLNYVTIPEIL